MSKAIGVAVALALLCSVMAQAAPVLLLEDNFESYEIYGSGGEGPWPVSPATWEHQWRSPPTPPVPPNPYSIKETPAVTGVGTSKSVKLEAQEGRLFHTFTPVTDGNLIATAYMRSSNANFRSVTFTLADGNWDKRSSYITMSGSANGSGTFAGKMAYATTAGFQVVPDFTLTTNEWVKVTVDIDVAASNYNLYLNDELKVANATFHTAGASLATSIDRIYFDNSGPATGWVDEVHVEWIPIPEPVALAPLMLLGLWVARRRR